MYTFDDLYEMVPSAPSFCLPVWSRFSHKCKIWFDRYVCLCAFPKWNRSFHLIQVDILVGNCHYQCNCEGLMKLANGLFIVNISWPGSERRKSEELEFESWKFLVKNLNGNYVAFSAIFTILHVYLYICVIVRQFAIPTGMFKTCFKLDIYF